MNWLLRQLGNLFSWLWARIYSAFEWLLDSIGSVFTWICNHIQAVAVALVATVGGVMPAESLSDTWAEILSGLTWVNPWGQWFLSECLQFPEFAARFTYLAGVVLAAYVVRGVFMSVRAFLDLL